MDTAAEFLKDVLVNKLGTTGVLLLLLAAVCIYAWYQHHSKKILQERIELEVEKRRQLAEAMLAAQATAPSAPRASRSSEFKVLIIDDEADIRNAMETHLVRTIDGVVVLHAQDGVAGLAAIKRESPDIIFMDVMMPNKNGFEVLEELKRLKITTPTVMISGYIDTIADINARSGDYRNNLSFLPKPFRLADVSSIIRENIQTSEK